jgi:DNA-binding NarL/FixJ family response regulator
MGRGSQGSHEELYRAKKTTSVFLLADNRLVRESVYRLLCKKTDISVVGHRSYSEDVIKQVVSAQCDVLLVDETARMNSGVDLVDKMMQALRSLKIIFLGIQDNERDFLRAVSSGVVGYLSREASTNDIVAAVRAVTRGEAVCPPHLTLLLLRYVNRLMKSAPIYRLKAEHGLTRRQQQLLSLVEKGWTNKEIACSLNLSEQTVKNHIHRILRRVQAEDRYQAVEAVRACGPLS